MPGSDQAWWLTALALAVLGLACGAWWARGDPARGRRRCPRCWYDMVGSPGLRCPECGHAARHERALGRTRRRRRWLVGSLVLLALGVGTAIVPDARAGGGRLWRRVPTTVLLGAEWLIGHDRWRDLTWHRGLRLTDPGLWDWQLRVLALRRARDLGLWRENWPEGMAVGVHGFVGREKDFTLLAPRFETDPDARVEPPAAPPGVSYEMLWHPPWRMVRESAGLAALPVEFERWENGRSAGVVRVDLPIRRVGSVDEAIAPVRDAALDAAVATTLGPTLVWLRERGVWAVAVREPTYDASPAVALGLVITIERDGEVVGTARLATRTTRAVGDMLPGAVVVGEGSGVAVALDHADATDPRWRVRVRGDGALALCVFGCDRYWAGEFTLPLGAVKK
ncbi:MAG: hypothetical protein JNK35_05475 [Phycisphaerae bacterium]|nr:hypothetical protein [Phycisphaerae bacterium]